MSNPEGPTIVLRMKQVIARVGLTRPTIYLRLKEGKFPKPIHLGVRAIGFLERDIEAWIQARVDAAQAQPSAGARLKT